jgi:hypothetical protein
VVGELMYNTQLSKAESEKGDFRATQAQNLVGMYGKPVPTIAKGVYTEREEIPPIPVITGGFTDSKVNIDREIQQWTIATRIENHIVK